jgi:ribosomal protein S27E/heme/copper-type cytochrome/quinol oxidase subunit 2
MDDKLINKQNKLLSLILIGGIISLIFFSVLPQISETYEVDSPYFHQVAPYGAYILALEGELSDITFYYGIDSIYENPNEQVLDNIPTLNVITILYWVLIIVSILMYTIFVIYYPKAKNNIFKISVLLSVFVVIIISLLLIFKIKFMQDINDIEHVSVASVIESSHPVKYIYISLLGVFILLIASFKQLGNSVIYYHKDVSRDKQKNKISKAKAVQKFKRSPIFEKKLSDLDKEEKEIDVVPDDIKKILLTDSSHFKQNKPLKEKSLNFEKNMSNDKKIFEPFEKEDNLKTEEFQKHNFKSFGEKSDFESGKKEFNSDREEKIIEHENKGIFEHKKIIEKIFDNDEKTLGDGESNHESKERNTNINPRYKKFKVKCPRCKNIFIIDKKIGEINHIKCPKCGKEGTINN